MVKLFKPTPNKEYIRAVDFGFIQQEYEHHGKKLHYLGLPSEGLYDIQTWDEFIDKIYAIERGSKLNPSSKQNILLSRAIRLGYSNRLTLFRGDVNNIIMNGKDYMGVELIYPFELVNLDYGGSLLYPDRIRIIALEKLIYNQRPVDFLFLLTTNVREFDTEELMKTQERIQEEITQFQSNKEETLTKYFEWINRTESYHRQVIHVFFFIKYLAEQNRYHIKCYPAIYYEGSGGTLLLHYIFRFRFVPEASTRVVSEQNIIELLNQEIMSLKDDKLEPIEHPPFQI